MSMQMDAEFQKEQNGTLFCWGGARGGGFWGGGGSRAPKPKNRVDVQYFFFGASWYVSKTPTLVSKQFSFSTFQNAVLQPGAMCLIFGLNLHSVLQLCLPNTNFCSPATTADRSVPRMR